MLLLDYGLIAGSFYITYYVVDKLNIANVFSGIGGKVAAGNEDYFLTIG